MVTFTILYLIFIILFSLYLLFFAKSSKDNDIIAKSLTPLFVCKATSVFIWVWALFMKNHYESYPVVTVSILSALALFSGLHTTNVVRQRIYKIRRDYLIRCQEPLWIETFQMEVRDHIE